ncbi:Fc receptor-like protein 5 isoform X1 [Trachinotus anak]|uniref:Fc receptor-like protein 5 isoform X1 n=1 Tax=Trachinotus anak TaxID=443729 RepID=UPI0039F18055
MEVTALCLGLMMNVLLPLAVQLHFSYSHKAAFPQVVPNRQQHFEHESIAVSCEGLEGLTGWRVLRKVKGVVKTCASTWEISTGPCKIDTAYVTLDSGQYWCEMGGVKRSTTVNITVTAGSVILESPVLPVMEGDNVTLRCMNKMSSSELTTEFYKDGLSLGGSDTGGLTLSGVSRSDEGLYKCSISGAGESAESWLTVRETTPQQDQGSSPHPPPPGSVQFSILLPVVVAILCVAVLLLVVGLLHYRKQKVSRPSFETPTPGSDPGCREAIVSDPNNVTYTVVTMKKMDTEPGVSSCSASPVWSAGSEEDHLYYTID